MRCLVTGIKGFVGANLAAELLKDGHEVTGIARQQGDLGDLGDLREITIKQCDICDKAALIEAMEGVDWVFHVAASYHLWLPDYAPMYEANVEGTRKVIEAALAQGVRRIIYTSTVGCIAVPRMSGGVLVPTNETCPVDEGQMKNQYKRSKWQAEQVALEFARQGAPVVVVNPSAPVGPRDAKPTPTGKIIVDYLNRRMPAYLDTGLNWVHVRDVAEGHILAAEKGRVGERYILGNAEGNWTMAETFSVLEKISGVRAPRLRIPYVVALGAAHVDEAIARWTGKAPKAPLAGVRMARYKMFFDPRKAIEELGLPQTPPEVAFEDAVRWFRDKGYVGA